MLQQYWVGFGVFLGILTVLLLRFIFQPYFNWKKQKAQSGGVKVCVIKNNKNSYKYEKYMEQTKQKSKPFLSLVVPAYNEEERLPIMLEKTIKFFQNKTKADKNFTYEIIVVNDSSKDNTTPVALKFENFENQQIDLKVVEYPRNKGKGGAVRCGMLLATGTYILMVDADGATEIEDYEKVFNKFQGLIENNQGLIAGSRNHLVKDVVTKRKWHRNLLMKISNFIVNTICGVKLKDTQCGFKLFTYETAQTIFPVLHLERWAFDVEIFMIANNYKIKYEEIPVNWRDVEGSKLDVVEASITMARDFLLVRLLYLLRIWKFNDTIFAQNKKQD